MAFTSEIENPLVQILKKEEGFIAKPKWDVKQWSWGYGSRVPDSTANPALNPGGVITPDRAMNDLLKEAKYVYDALYPLIKRKLNGNQWAALISFGYNLGVGNAKNLIADINGNSAGLEAHWKQYVHSGGKVNPDLVKRRDHEWTLWNTPVATTVIGKAAAAVSNGIAGITNDPRKKKS
jgi:lysozyme